MFAKVWNFQNFLNFWNWTSITQVFGKLNEEKNATLVGWQFKFLSCDVISFIFTCRSCSTFCTWLFLEVFREIPLPSHMWRHLMPPYPLRVKKKTCFIKYIFCSYLDFLWTDFENSKSFEELIFFWKCWCRIYYLKYKKVFFFYSKTVMTSQRSVFKSRNCSTFWKSSFWWPSNWLRSGTIDNDWERSGTIGFSQWWEIGKLKATGNDPIVVLDPIGLSMWHHL